MAQPRPIALLILDGWGYSETPQHNAIAAASKPVWDRLWQQYPHSLLRTSGAAVGLPGDQMGNSEVGHLNLGSGRVVYQEFTRVSRSIKTGSFFTNATLTDAVDLATETGKAVHIIGLLSTGGVRVFAVSVVLSGGGTVSSACTAGCAANNRSKSKLDAVI